MIVLNAAASIFAFNGHPEEGAKAADKSLRIDPRANSVSLNTLKDAYFYDRRFKDLIAVVSRVPEDARSRGSRLYLAFSYALLGQHDDAERARAAVLAHYPTISAEQMMNQGCVFTRPQEQKSVSGRLPRDVSACMCRRRRSGQVRQASAPARMPEADGHIASGRRAGEQGGGKVPKAVRPRAAQAWRSG